MEEQTPSAAKADLILFGDVLSCEMQLPVRLLAEVGTPRPHEAEAMLRSLAQIEDLRSEESGEDHRDLPLAVQRMDAKLDLMLVLIGRLVQQRDDALPLHMVRWSARGLRLPVEGTALPVGSLGSVRLQPSDWLPESIALPVEVIAVEPPPHAKSYWLRFTEVGAGLQEALERHLFRLHRRQIADARRPR